MDAIRFVEEMPFDIAPAPRRYTLNRQCALCDHPTLEHQWLCNCCMSIDRFSFCSKDHSPERVIRPLLPPFLPPGLAMRDAVPTHGVTCSGCDTCWPVPR